MAARTRLALVIAVLLRDVTQDEILEDARGCGAALACLGDKLPPEFIGEPLSGPDGPQKLRRHGRASPGSKASEHDRVARSCDQRTFMEGPHLPHSFRESLNRG